MPRYPRDALNGKNMICGDLIPLRNSAPRNLALTRDFRQLHFFLEGIGEFYHRAFTDVLNRYVTNVQFN